MRFEGNGWRSMLGQAAGSKIRVSVPGGKSARRLFSQPVSPATRGPREAIAASWGEGTGLCRRSGSKSPLADSSKGAFTLILLPEAQRLAAAGAEFVAPESRIK